MAAAADSAEGVFASKSGRALAFACSFTICLLAAGALAITLLGRPQRARYRQLDLPRGRQARMRRRRPVAGRTTAPSTGPVTKPLYAGKALLADPGADREHDPGALAAHRR